MPAIAKILTVFFLMLLVTRARVPLGLSLPTGGVLLARWVGQSWREALAGLWDALVGAELWMFVLITFLIIDVARYITKRENATQITAAIQRWGGRHGAACALMAVPAAIGLIPMAAGALFSAPFVQEVGQRIQAESNWKTVVNFWFRHVWECWWPLYGGVIVGMSIFEMDAWQFIAVQLPYTPVAVAAGFFFLVRPHLDNLAKLEDAANGSARRVMVLTMPLCCVVAAIFLVPLGLRAWGVELDVTIRKMLALLVGLAGGMVLILIDEIKQHDVHIFASALKLRSWSVLFSVAGVMIFKEMLDGTGVLDTASHELAMSGIPVGVVIAVLPFLAGLVTGLGIGFAGASFPLVAGLMGAAGSPLTPLATLVLAYGAGFVGMMVSPVHLCLLTTKQYFKADFVSIYRELLPCAAVVLVYAFCAYMVLGAMGL